MQSVLSRYYAGRGEWSGIQPFVEQMGTLYGQRIIVVDSSGVVVADSHEGFLGRRPDPRWSGRVLPIRPQMAVVPNSPADKAGLKGGGTDASGSMAAGGEIIRAVDGRSVGSVEDLVSYFTTRKAGDKVTLSVVRNSETLEVTVTLGVRP